MSMDNIKPKDVSLCIIQTNQKSLAKQVLLTLEMLAVSEVASCQTTQFMWLESQQYLNISNIHCTPIKVSTHSNE